MSNPAPVFPTQFTSTDAVESTAIVWSEFTPDDIFNAGHYVTVCSLPPPIFIGLHNTLDDGMWEWQAIKLIALTHIVDVREYLLAVECAGHIQHEWSQRGRYGIWTKTHFGFDVEILAQMRGEAILDRDNIATLLEAGAWGAHNIDPNTVKRGSLRRFKNMVIISSRPYQFFDLLKNCFIEVPKMHIRNHEEGFPSLWQLEEFMRWHLEEEFMLWCNPLEDGMEWAYNTTQAPGAYNINATAVRMQSLQRFQNAVITGIISRPCTFHLSSDGNFKFNHRGVSPPSPAQDSNEDDEKMPELRNCSGSDDSDEE
ncbi:hypothetical protein B0H16DRAFT_1470318 [Mycena metata]|uniref:Uncharacterized protein n=1 Tax=Mycena metata TaxID=1033252 RepID=A0AAD7HUJ3_9AGAR|nr:hypothetical protein B0H16DRAFT_1470318 [Mycena metata]